MDKPKTFAENVLPSVYSLISQFEVSRRFLYEAAHTNY